MAGWALGRACRAGHSSSVAQSGPGAERSRTRAAPGGAGCCAGHRGRAVGPLSLGALAQGYGQGGQAEEGLRVIAEALAVVEKNEERWNEAELYRIKGELTAAAGKATGSGK